MGSEEKKPVCWLTRFGVCGTAVYIVGLGFLIAFRWADFGAIEINAWGDFLAGAFGPPAFLWLILGFFLQRRELQQSTEALRLQAEELRNSVEQQRELVEVNRRQMQAEMEALREQREKEILAASPNFEFGIECTIGLKDGELTSLDYLYVRNIGSDASNIQIKFEERFLGISEINIAFLKRGDVFKKLTENIHHIEIEESNVKIKYIDYMNRLGVKDLILIKQKDGRHIYSKEISLSSYD